MAKSLFEMSVKDAMAEKSAEIVSVSKNDSLNVAVSKMIENNIHNVAVFEQKKFAGFFGYKQLVKMYRKSASKTRVDAYVFKPPEISLNSAIIDAAEIMYRLNYKILPVSDNGEFLGILSERDVLKKALESQEFKLRKVEEFMTPAPISVRETDNIGTALRKIRDLNISRLPVVNNENKLSGIVEAFDILKVMVGKKDGYGVIKQTIGTIKGGGIMESFFSEIIPDQKIAVKAIMNKEPVTCSIGDTLSSAFGEALKRKMSALVVVDSKNHPLGIAVPKDVITFIAGLKEKDKIIVHVSGLESENMATDFEKEQIRRMVSETARKIASLMDISLFTMHFKSYGGTGGKEGGGRNSAGKKKYSVRCKIDTKYGLYVFRDFGWDLINTVSRLLSASEDALISEKKKIKNKSIGIERMGKWVKNGIA